MRNYKITNTLQGKNIVYRLKLIRVANVANEVAKPKHKFQTKLHTGSKSSKSSNIFWALEKENCTRSNHSHQHLALFRKFQKRYENPHFYRKSCDTPTGIKK